jgi:hypothetical protein
LSEEDKERVLKEYPPVASDSGEPLADDETWYFFSLGSVKGRKRSKKP